MIEPALFLEVTRRCNNRCKYCGSWRYSGVEKGELTKSEYRKFFNIVKDMNFPRISFTGGEPTIRKDIKEIVSDAIYIVGGEVHLTTNGSLILQNKKLWDLPLSLIKININTLDNEVYKNITGMDNLPKVVAGIDYLLGEGKKIRLHSVIFKESIATVINLIEYCDDRKIDLKLFQIDTDLSSTDKNITKIDEIEKYLMNTTKNCSKINSPGLPIQVYERNGGNEVHVVKSNLPKYNHKLCSGCEKFPCKSGLYSISLDPNGYIYPCLIEPDRMKRKLNLDDEASVKEDLNEIKEIIMQAKVI